MSCLLCDSYYHVTKDCNIYISDDDRKDMLQLKSTSFTQFCSFISPTKCYACCSKDHNAIFCPNRFTARKHFIPKLDQNLFQRFLSMLDAAERQFLAFQSPTIFNLCTLRPMAIINELKNRPNRFIHNLPADVIILCKNVEIDQHFVVSDIYKILYERIISNESIVLTENVHLSNIHFTVDTFYSLLSSKTKVFKVTTTALLSKIALDEIFENAPNLEELQFEFDAWHDHAWQNDNFFKYKYGKMFKKLKIIVNRDFDVATLVPFMNKDPPNISIDVYVSIIAKARNARQKFMKKISRFFMSAQSSSNQSFSLYFRVRGRENDEFKFIDSFILTNWFDY